MPDHPHILILMPDQQRADCLSCAGHPVIRTPNMDRLAAEGVRFARATTTSPLCMPARSSFISGMYPHQTGIWTNSGSLPADSPTFFHALRRVGYRTAHIGKSHYYGHRADDHLKNCEQYMTARGFDYVHETTGPHATRRSDSYMTDHWDRLGLLRAFRDDYGRRAQEGPLVVRASPLPWEEYLDSYVGRQAVEYVERCDDRHATCTFVGFPGPHEPWDAPQPYASMYGPDAAPPSIPPEDGDPWLSEYVRKKMSDGRVANLTPHAIAEIRANYYGKISLIDCWVGRILDAYERRGWLRNTLVFFWSDHGEMAGDHGRLHKQVSYNGSVDIPFIVRWPGRVPAGVVSDALVQQADIYPTIMEMIGEKNPAEVAGRSLMPLFQDPSRRHREAAISEVALNRNSRTLMVETERWKYVMDDTGAGMLLFDEREDPNERRNLVGHVGYRHVEAAMREQALRFLMGEQTVL